MIKSISKVNMKTHCTYWLRGWFVTAVQALTIITSINILKTTLCKQLSVKLTMLLYKFSLWYFIQTIPENKSIKNRQFFKQKLDFIKIYAYINNNLLFHFHHKSLRYVKVDLIDFLINFLVEWFVQHKEADHQCENC